MHPAASRALRRAGLAGAMALLLCKAVPAQTLRWALAGDAETMDPHALSEAVTTNVNQLVYEPLVDFDAARHIVPSLAQRWSAPEPMRWRFELRPGVRFHDGTPLDADDVVFSILRAQQPSSSFAAIARRLGAPVRIDAATVELRLDTPNPLLLEDAGSVLVMSRRWTEANGAARVPDFRAREEAATTRQAMGTGPYRLVERRHGVRTVFERHPGHWAPRAGNVERVELLPIANGATRIAALFSNDVDLVQDVPPQDAERIEQNPALRIAEIVEDRVLYLGLDLWRDELRYGSEKDRNPLKDPRVREAIALAIDPAAMQRALLRGRGELTRCLAVARRACLVPELETPLQPDPERARRLLAEAGWPDGFALTLDCANDRFVAGIGICNALAAQLARIGVRLAVDARSKSIVFPKLQQGDTSAYLMGIGAPYVDGQWPLELLVHRPDAVKRKGTVNFGRIGDAELDHLIDDAAVEPDTARRNEMLREAQRRVGAGRLLLPLLRPPLIWATRAHVHPVVTPNNFVRPEWVRIGKAAP